MHNGGSRDAALIAANIRRGQREKGLSGRSVSVALGVTETQVWRWRTAKSQPHAERMHGLADLLFDGDVNQLYWPAEDSAA